MGRSFADVYQVGKTYRFKNIFYHAIGEKNKFVTFKPIGVSFAAPEGTKLPIKNVLKKQQYRYPKY